MIINICKDYDEMSRAAASVFAAQIITKPNSVLGFATGSTPEGTYKELVKMYKDGIISFKDITSFNLDEYVGISRENDQSYYYFMHHHLFDHVDINESNVNIPNTSSDLEKECMDYERRIKEAGGIDLQIVGIGNNGHIGFNEPCDNFVENTNIVSLQQRTIEANARFFESINDVPTKAVTMGIGTIMRAKKVVLVASGQGKADIIRDVVKGKVTPQVPAS
ncbi:MAG: glucosamine-6-phosphate deaminase, partial [Clostridia bacterium]|nr:glucosamine-6-phosphate deaminase [Clostridia bacterium]